MDLTDAAVASRMLRGILPQIPVSSPRQSRCQQRKASSRRDSTPSNRPANIIAAANQIRSSGRRRIVFSGPLPCQPSSVATSPRYQVWPYPRSISRAARSWSPAESACSMAKEMSPFCSFQTDALPVQFVHALGTFAS